MQLTQAHYHQASNKKRHSCISKLDTLQQPQNLQANPVVSRSLSISLLNGTHCSQELQLVPQLEQGMHDHFQTQCSALRLQDCLEVEQILNAY